MTICSISLKSTCCRAAARRLQAIPGGSAIVPRPKAPYVSNWRRFIPYLLRSGRTIGSEAIYGQWDDLTGNRNGVNRRVAIGRDSAGGTMRSKWSWNSPEQDAVSDLTAANWPRRFKADI